MEFPSERVTYYEVWGGNFNRFVSERFQVEYHYADGLDYPAQDTYRTYKVGMDDYNGEYVWNIGYDDLVAFRMDDFLADLRGPREDSPTPEDVLEALYTMGEIPAGEYLFTIWW